MQKKRTEIGPQTYRLNKYLSLAGVATSRRNADLLIQDGLISVNGNVCTNFGYQVDPSIDKVLFRNKPVNLPSDLHYVLLNKPKNTICTRKDERDRKTIYSHLNYPFIDQLKPVGRLDRNTTGLILLTNDGDLINLLTHPSHEVTKIYQVTTENTFSTADIEKLSEGADLEDGHFAPDEIVLLESRNQVGVQIHSGKNRIVRRYFEHFGFPVKQLDRVFFAGLTKHNLPRGKSRILTPKEVRNLRSQVKKRSKPDQ